MCADAILIFFKKKIKIVVVGKAFCPPDLLFALSDPALKVRMMLHLVEILLQERGYKFASSSGSGQPEVQEAPTPFHSCTLNTFSGIRQSDGTRVKLKVMLNNNNNNNLSLPIPPPPPPSLLPRCLSNFQHEHRIVEQLREVDGVVKIHERFSVANVVEALVMEDFGGECLDEWLRREGPFVERLAEFMELAIEVTKTLSQIHAHNIVHKNIQVSVLLAHFTCLVVVVVSFSNTFFC